MGYDDPACCVVEDVARFVTSDLFIACLSSKEVVGLPEGTKALECIISDGDTYPFQVRSRAL
jgi:hypothetical protein